MKTIFLITLAALFFCSCHKNSDFDLLPGSFHMFSPISVNGIVLNQETWILTNDSLTIYRADSLVHAERVLWHDGRVDLFPMGSNPYYESSLSGGQINTIYWGFYYQVEGLPKFTLQRID